MTEQKDKFTLYLVYCKVCNEYKRICTNPPMGPGGTLSCPICKSKKQHGPHIEGAYGIVKSKSFKIELPNELLKSLEGE